MRMLMKQSSPPIITAVALFVHSTLFYKRVQISKKQNASNTWFIYQNFNEVVMLFML